MEQRRQYKNPPIEEALCEFRFKPSQDWDFTMPGKLHGELKEEYPGKPRQQNVVEAALQAQPGKPPNIMLREGLAKVQLVTEDGKRIVAVGPDVLSIHMLRPYQNPDHPEQSGWDEFRPRIEAALAAYWRVAEPLGVLRAGIRYINKIVVARSPIAVEKYFKCAPPEVPNLPETMSAFISKVEYLYDDGAKLLLSHASVDAPKDHGAFLLDIDVVWEFQEPLDQDQTFARLDDLRHRERTAFESIITDEARRLFDAD